MDGWMGKSLYSECVKVSSGSECFAAQILRRQCDSASPRRAPIYLSDLLCLFLISSFPSPFLSLAFVFRLSGWRHASAPLIIFSSSIKATFSQHSYLSLSSAAHIRTVYFFFFFFYEIWVASFSEQSSLFSESRSCWEMSKSPERHLCKQGLNMWVWRDPKSTTSKCNSSLFWNQLIHFGQHV